MGEAGRAVLWPSQNVAPVGQRPVGWLHVTLPWDQEEIRGEGAECRVYLLVAEVAPFLADHRVSPRPLLDPVPLAS